MGKPFTFTSHGDEAKSVMFRVELDIWAEDGLVVLQANDPYTHGCSTRVRLTRTQVLEVIDALQELIKEG